MSQNVNVHAKKAKKPAPIVKHTKTSLYRMIKANPLLLCDQSQKNARVRTDIDELGLPFSVLGNMSFASSSIPSDLHEITLKNEKPEPKKTLTKPPVITASKSTLNPSNITQKVPTGRVMKPAIKSNRPAPKEKISKTVTIVTGPKRTQTQSSALFQEPSGSNMFKFNTPSAYNRRSIKKGSALSNNSKNKNMYKSAIGLNELQKKLNSWLEKKDEAVCSYHHLNQFGLNDNAEENKENIEPYPPLAGSYEELNTTYTCETKEEINLVKVAHDALTDLHKLILEGYAIEQCEKWLNMIKQKCRDICNDPEYWECKAAIQQLNGNMPSAAEFYHNADKEIQSNNNKSLETLLNNFGLLKIEMDVGPEAQAVANGDVVPEININGQTITNLNGNNKGKNENKQCDSNRNVGGSILQFAVRETNSKRNGEFAEKYMVTPVKRSTRTSRSAYVNTPDVKICASLNDLSPDIRNNMKFLNNVALD